MLVSCLGLEEDLAGGSSTLGETLSPVSSPALAARGFLLLVSDSSVALFSF